MAFAARGDARGARAVWLLHELERDLVRKWGLVDGDRRNLKSLPTSMPNHPDSNKIAILKHKEDNS